LLKAEEAAKAALKAEEELASVPDLAGMGLLESFIRRTEAEEEAVKLEVEVEECEAALRRDSKVDLACGENPVFVADEAKLAPEEPSVAAPASEADESAVGAYLVYQTRNNGQMDLVWSKVAVENALLFGRPQKIVPAFKFARDGHWELTRNIQSDKRTWYLGWVMFVKACAAFDCTVVDFGLTGEAAPMPTSLWLWSTEGSTVSAVAKGEPFDTRNFTVVAACHADSKDLSFQSIKRDVFENKAKDVGECTALR